MVFYKNQKSYQFEGGTTFEFEKHLDQKQGIFSQRTDGVDVDVADIQQTVKLVMKRLFKHPVGVTTSQETERTLNALLGAKLVEMTFTLVVVLMKQMTNHLDGQNRKSI